MFKVTNKGVVTIGNGAVDDNNGRRMKHWTITTSNANDETKDSYIAYNTNYFYDLNSLTTLNTPSLTNVYLGTDGISLGRNFSVNNSGFLSIRKGKIQLGPNQETINGQTVITSWNFSVDDNGYLQAQRGQIAGVEIYKHNNISEIRAGTKYVDESGVIDTNRLNQGFVFQSTGRILGIGEQVSNSQDSKTLYEWAVFLIKLMTTITDAQGNVRPITEQERQALLDQAEYDYEHGRYNGKVSYNIWEFSAQYGIFRGGVSEWSVTDRYKMQEEHFRIQPANGYSRFMHSDVVGTLTVGEKIRGVKGKTYTTISRFNDSDQTFFIDCNNGHAGFRQISLLGTEFKGYSGVVQNENQMTCYIDPKNGWASFTKILGSGSATYKVGDYTKVSFLDVISNINTGGTLTGYQYYDSDAEDLGPGSGFNTPTYSIAASTGAAYFRKISSTIFDTINTISNITGYSESGTDSETGLLTFDSEKLTFYIHSSDGSASFKNLTVGNVQIEGGDPTDIENHPGSIKVNGQSIVAVFG